MKSIHRCFFCGKICWDTKVAPAHENCVIAAYAEDGYDFRKSNPDRAKELERFRKEHVLVI
jgi:hypothetical protein